MPTPIVAGIASEAEHERRAFIVARKLLCLAQRTIGAFETERTIATRECHGREAKEIAARRRFRRVAVTRLRPRIEPCDEHDECDSRRGSQHDGSNHSHVGPSRSTRTM